MSNFPSPLRFTIPFVALELVDFLARKVLAHFQVFVRPVPAVVLAVAEQPLWDAPVVGRAWTSSPSSGAVSVPAEVSRLVCVVAAVVVVVAVPQLGDALAVPALELSLVVAGSLVAHVLCLV